MKSDQLGRVLSDDDLPTKLSIANEFKAFVKKNSVPRDSIHPYFLTLSRAIKSREDPQLTSVCFSCFCHLFKRVSIQDKLLLDDSATVSVVTDLLIDRLSDRSNNVRATANKVLLDYWVLVPQAVAVAMRQSAVVSSSHVTLGESVKWLQSVFDLSSAFNFSAFVQPVVDMLKYPQLQSAVTELLKKVYSVSDRRELEECLAATGVNEMLKKSILSGLPGGYTDTKPVRSISNTQRPKPPVQSTQPPPPTQPSEGKENAPSSSLAFLDSLPTFRVESIPGENVYSASDLESKFQNMHAAFADKESEKNWSLREKHVIQIRKLLRGNALENYPSQFAQAYKSVIDGVLKSATSLRTTLSNHGLLLIKESGQLGGSGFVDPVMDIVLPQIIRLTGQMKKITSNNAHVTICGLLTSATFSTKLISHVTAATLEKNAQPRTFAAVWLRIIILSHSQSHKTTLQNHGGLEQLEKAIAKGLQDPNPSVKENTRVTYWSFAEFWPAEADKIYQKLDTKAKGMLDKVNPSGAKNAPVRKPAQRESLKDVMRRSRESSVNRDAPPVGGAPQRAKMGAPQRTSSGLVGRSLSGSHVTDRSSGARLSGTSRDQSRAVSDSTAAGRMTRSVSGRTLSREPSLTRGSRDQGRSSSTASSRDPSLTRGSRDLPKQRVENRPRVPSISRDSRFGQQRQSSGVHSRDPSRQRESSAGLSRESSADPSVASRDVKDELPSYDVDMDDDDPFVTQQLKLSLKETEGADSAGTTGASAPIEIPQSRDTKDTSPDPLGTPPSSSPFVLAKSPATQGVSTSPAQGKSASPPATAEEELSRDLREGDEPQESHASENAEARDQEDANDTGGMDVDHPESQEVSERDVDMGGQGEPVAESREQEAPEVESHDPVETNEEVGLREEETHEEVESHDPVEANDVNTDVQPPHELPVLPKEQAEPESLPDVADSQPHGADSAEGVVESNTSTVAIVSPRPVHPAKFELDSDVMDVEEDGNEEVVNEGVVKEEEAKEVLEGKETTGVENGHKGTAEVENGTDDAIETENGVDNVEAEAKPETNGEAATNAEVESHAEALDIPDTSKPDNDANSLSKSSGSDHVTEAVQEDPFKVQTEDTNMSAHDESIPMEMCDSDNEEKASDMPDLVNDESKHVTQPLDFATRDLKEELNTASPQELSTLLSQPEQYKDILGHVPAELFLLCVILFSPDHVTDAQNVISQDTNLALSTASSMVMVCARDVYPSDSRWSRATVDELKHVTVTCLDWLTKLVNESSEASTLLSTNKRYRTSLVHLLSTSVELHKQKFGHVTHNSLIHVIEAMDKLSQRPVDKRTSRAFLEAPSPSPDSSMVEDVTDKLSHVSVKEHVKTVRILPPQLASGHVVAPGSEVTWSKLELERLARTPHCQDSLETILDTVSIDKVSVTQLSTLASRVPQLEDVDHVTATVLAYLHISHPPALTTAALVVIKQVLVKPGLHLSMGHVTEIFSTLNHVNSHIDSRSPLAAAIEELVADLLTHADPAEMLEFLLLSRSRDSKTQNKLLLLNTVYHVISPELLPSHETQILALISELISDPDPLVRRVTVGLVVRVLRLSPEMEGSVSLAIKSKMDLVRYYMGAQ